MSSRTHHILLAGGGTAGHVNPCLAVASAIRNIEPDADIEILGTKEGLEARLVPQAGFKLVTIEKVPFPRKPNKAALQFPMKWRRETKKVRSIINEQHTQVVAGFGGYASAPAYWVAHKMGIPIVIHEQNAKPGMANVLGTRWATFLGTAYDTDLKAGERTTIERVGLPLRPAIAELAERMQHDRKAVREDAARELGIDPTKPTIVVTGGSLGAQHINEAIAASARELLQDAQIVHLTGRGKLDEVRDLVTKSAGSDVISGLFDESDIVKPYHMAEYLKRIDLAFACADLVVCRSGAGTVSELTALGLPAVYVPLAIGNGEQRFNAQPVVDALGGWMVSDANFTADWVQAHIPQLMSNPQQLKQAGENAWQYGIRDAAARMAHEILALCDAKNAHE